MSDNWTPGEARVWARRLRKVGFSPVSLHYDTDGTVAGDTGGWYLRCIWPYAIADLPLDLLDDLIRRDYNVVEDVFDYWDDEWVAVSRFDAHRLLTRFRVVRLGMGSRPLPIVDRSPWEPKFIPAGRIVTDADDWPLGTQWHPEYIPEWISSNPALAAWYARAVARTAK